MRISSGTTGQSLSCLGLIREDREDLAEADEIKGATNPRGKGADSEVARVGTRALIVFDQSGEARGVDIGHGGEIEE